MFELLEIRKNRWQVVAVGPGGARATVIAFDHEGPTPVTYAAAKLVSDLVILAEVQRNG